MVANIFMTHCWASKRLKFQSASSVAQPLDEMRRAKSGNRPGRSLLSAVAIDASAISDLRFERKFIDSSAWDVYLHRVGI